MTRVQPRHIASDGKWGRKPSRRFVLSVLLLVGLVLTGWGLLSGALIILDVQPEAVSAGEAMNVTVENTSLQGLGVNLCPIFIHLDRLDDGTWSRLGTVTDENGTAQCTLQEYILKPFRSTTSKVWLPEDIDRGTYRLSYSPTLRNKPSPIFTDPFRVN